MSWIDKTLLEQETQEIKKAASKKWKTIWWVLLAILLTFWWGYKVWELKAINQNNANNKLASIENAQFNASIVSIENGVIVFKCEKKDFIRSQLALKYMKFVINWKEVTMSFWEWVSNHTIVWIKIIKEEWKNDQVEFSLQVWEFRSFSILTVDWVRVSVEESNKIK